MDTDLHIGQGRELDRGEQIVSNAFLEKDRRVRRVVGDRSIESWHVICTDCVRDGEGLPRRCDCGKGQEGKSNRLHTDTELQSNAELRTVGPPRCLIRLEIYTFANKLRWGSVALCSCDEWACDLRPNLSMKSEPPLNDIIGCRRVSKEQSSDLTSSINVHGPRISCQRL